MTFSLLALDPDTGALGGAAVTGNLCVGGWVLRGDARFGLSASQGHMPSTLWGEDAQAMLAQGTAPRDLISRIVAADPGREMRQLSVLAADGAVGGFDGNGNEAYTGHLEGPGWIVSGNWLESRAVIERAAEALVDHDRPFPDRLVAALKAGVAAGSDRRGSLSAALLVLAEDRPPLDLRIDRDAAPVERLDDLLQATRASDYREWFDHLPTRQEPHRT